MDAIFALELFTACAVAVVMGVAWWKSERAADRAEKAAHRLLKLRGQVVEIETELHALNKSHRKFMGAWYRARATDDDDEHEPVSEVDTGTLEACPNWRTPQFPIGDDCDYCTAMRAQREAALAQTSPVGATLAALRRTE